MSSTHEEKLARRRITEKARRERIADERAERLVLLEENNELKMRILELEKENAKIQNSLDKYQNDFEYVPVREYHELVKRYKKPVVVEPVAEKKVEFKVESPWFEWIDRNQTKRLFNIPHKENLDNKGFINRAVMIFGMLDEFGYEKKDYNKDVLPMLRDKKVSLKGLGKLFDIYQNQEQVFESVMQMIDQHDYPYAEINHPSLNDDFTI